jgi:N-acetyl-alpha-D-muramate 1-phosphate uridylyltransferase
MTAGSHAMILAAGFGLRMRPLTLATPKPLIKVNGKALIDYAVDKLAGAGVQKAVVNGHYLAEQIEAWSASVGRLRMIFSDERDAILDTGGGIARALRLLGPDPFFVMNADCFWLDGEVPALERLKSRWDDGTMDCLLLLCDPAATTGYDGKGDFVVGDEGRILGYRKADDPVLPVYIGGYLVHPRLFEEAPAGSFSMHGLWKKAIAQGRLFGLAHDGHWLHVGTVEAIDAAERYLRTR